MTTKKRSAKPVSDVALRAPDLALRAPEHSSPDQEKFEAHRQSIIAKIKTFKLSGKMAALAGCIVGERLTNPKIEQLLVTSDGMVMAMVEGHCGFNDFVGAFSELKNNWEGLITACGLNQAEWKVAMQLFEQATGIGADNDQKAMATIDELSRMRYAKAKKQFIERTCRYRWMQEIKMPQLVVDEEAKLINQAFGNLRTSDLIDVMRNFDRHYEEFKKHVVNPPLADG